MELFGVKLLGLSALTARKALLTIVFTVGLIGLRFLLLAIVGAFSRNRPQQRFWARQTLSIFMAVLLLLSLLSIWFDDPSRLATGVGLVSAGLAFALQKVVTSLAGYLVIIRGRIFRVGDRITMGGVRGDVMALGFLKTTIMEMGDPTGEPLSIWVHGRQYTGRIVTVTNDKVFEEPVFNLTRDFPFIWDEIRVPIPYAADRARAERILIEAAEEVTAGAMVAAQPHVREMKELYEIQLGSLKPRVYWRITDNWLELTVRFIVDDRSSRDFKDSIARKILAAFDEAKIGIASATLDVVAFPPIRAELAGPGAPKA